jgi:hypothetical protein
MTLYEVLYWIVGPIVFAAIICGGALYLTRPSQP